MYCKNCGNKIAEGTSFCPNCGMKVENVKTENMEQQNGSPKTENVEQQNGSPKTENMEQSNGNPKTENVKQPNDNFQNETMEKPDNAIISQIVDKEKISLIIWAVIAGCQIFIGLFIYDVAFYVGIWNVVACIMSYNFCKKIQKSSIGIYDHYNNNLIACIVFLLINLFAGGVIGVAGAGYDLYVRNFAMKNKDKLIALEEYEKSQNVQ